MRAARAMLGIDQRTLAELAGVSVPTIQRMEASQGNVRGVIESLTRIVEALDRAGVEMIAEGAASAAGGRGVRLKPMTPAGLAVAGVAEIGSGRCRRLNSPPSPPALAGARPLAGGGRWRWPRASGVHLWRVRRALRRRLLHRAAGADRNGPDTALVLPLGLPWLGAHLRLDALSAFFLVVLGIGGGVDEPLRDRLRPARARAAAGAAVLSGVPGGDEPGAAGRRRLHLPDVLGVHVAAVLGAGAGASPRGGQRARRAMSIW